MIASFDTSQETFSVDILTALKSSLKHRRKHVLRSLQLYGDQALFQMTEQSYPSLFALTIGFIPMSIKRLLCDFDYKPMSIVKD